MKLVEIKKEQSLRESSPFSIDWLTVRTLTLDERMNYFVNLATSLVSREVTDAVHIGDFRINKCDEALFYTCFDEYMTCLKKLNKEKFRKKLSFLARNYLPKAFYNTLKNKNLSSLKEYVTEVLGLFHERKAQVLNTAVIFSAFIIATSNLLTKDSSTLAYAYSTDVVESEMPIQNMDLVKDVIDGYSITVVPSIEEEIVVEEKKDEYFGKTNLDLIICDLVTYDAEKNNEILPGYHWTTGNITYELSESDYRKLVYVVWKESNRTYEGALGVISTILNRAEDPRYAGLSLIEIISADSQFTVWNEDKANAFAAAPSMNCPQGVWDAVYDAMSLGIRNHDYVEFRSSGSLDYIKNDEGEIVEWRYQFVEKDNKYFNLALSLGRVEIYEENLEYHSTPVAIEALQDSIEDSEGDFSLTLEPKG